MQAISQRLRATQPFCSVRPAVNARAVPSRTLHSSPKPCFVAQAASAAFDLSEYGADVDVRAMESVAAAPLASEKVRLRIRMRGYDINLLADAVEQIRAIADTTGSIFKGPVMLPTRKRIYCVLRSPHVNKDSREHFEIRTHHRLIDLKSLSAQTVEAMMQWVPPAGLEVEASIV